jgi:hypothetical protein
MKRLTIRRNSFNLFFSTRVLLTAKKDPVSERERLAFKLRLGRQPFHIRPRRRPLRKISQLKFISPPPNEADSIAATPAHYFTLGWSKLLEIKEALSGSTFCRFHFCAGTRLYHQQKQGTHSVFKERQSAPSSAERAAFA